MTEYQQVLFDLLVEIDEICRKEHIPYFIGDKIALSAYQTGRFFPDCCEASVLMTTDDAKRFMKAVRKEKRADRFLDSMRSVRNYPDFTLRYGDRNTLFYSFLEKERCQTPGFAVKIKMIRFKPKRFGAVMKMAKMFWDACCWPVVMAPTMLGAASFVCHGIQAILGPRLIGRMIYGIWSRGYSGKGRSKKTQVTINDHKFTAAILDKPGTLTMEGHEFCYFGNAEEYLTGVYGEDYANAVTTYIKPSSDRLMDAGIPYRDFFCETEDCVDFKEYEKRRRKSRFLYTQVGYYNKKINHYYAIVDRSEKRFSLYMEYMPQKEHLMQLAAEGKYDEANEILKPYRSALYDFKKKRLGLCFDKDIFDLTMTILEREGKESYAAKLRQLVPAEHWKPICIVDYKGEPVR